MEGATHFIEVWRYMYCDKVVNSHVMPINKLQQTLGLTDYAMCKTIAVWKIKQKQNTNAK